jgi:hypothetical protein
LKPYEMATNDLPSMIILERVHGLVVIVPAGKRINRHDLGGKLVVGSCGLELNKWFFVVDTEGKEDS